MSLLAINSSPVTGWSVTRRMMTRFLDHYAGMHPGTPIVERDIGRNPPPHIDEATIDAYYARAEPTPAQRHALALSGELVGEFLAAKTIVIAAPMHNLGITSGLKAYFDHIVRAGHTFAYTAQGPRGLVTGKTAYILTARGSDYSTGGPLSALDQQETYLRTILGFIGIDDLAFIHCQGVALGEDTRATALAAAERQIDGLFAPAVAWA